MSKVVKRRKDGTLRVILTERQAQLVLGIRGHRMGDNDFVEPYLALKAIFGGKNPMYDKVEFGNAPQRNGWWYK